MGLIYLANTKIKPAFLLPGFCKAASGIAARTRSEFLAAMKGHVPDFKGDADYLALFNDTAKIPLIPDKLSLEMKVKDGKINELPLEVFVNLLYVGSIGFQGIGPIRILAQFNPEEMYPSLRQYLESKYEVKPISL